MVVVFTWKIQCPTPLSIHTSQYWLCYLSMQMAAAAPYHVQCLPFSHLSTTLPAPIISCPTAIGTRQTSECYKWFTHSSYVLMEKDGGSPAEMFAGKQICNALLSGVSGRWLQSFLLRALAPFSDQLNLLFHVNPWRVRLRFKRV